MVFVWRLEGRLSELFCAVLYTTVVHNHKHTYEWAQHKTKHLNEADFIIRLLYKH